jgi:RNA polymerase sigma-70 factor (ECF subfamily)
VGSDAAVDRAEVEAQVLASMGAGDFSGAAGQIVRGFGAELYGWLSAVLGPSDAADVFGAFEEELLRSLPSFRAETSARSWSYLIAKSCARKHARSELRRRLRMTPLDNHSSVLERATPSASSNQASTLDRLRQFRAALPQEDQDLLILRVDRGFSFNEIAGILLGEQATAQQLERESARLRKRLEAIRKAARVELGA